MEIISVKEKEFKEYGRVIEGLDVAQLLQKMQKTPLPDDVIYEPSDASLEALEVCEVLRRSVYGGLPVQSVRSSWELQASEVQKQQERLPVRLCCSFLQQL